MPSPTKAPQISADIRPPRSTPSRGGMRPYTVGFYLVPDFPMMAFSAAIEPLRARQSAFRARSFSTGACFHATALRCGRATAFDIAVGSSIRDSAALDMLLVCAGSRRRRPRQAARPMAARARAVGHLGRRHQPRGLCAGARRLARWPALRVALGEPGSVRRTVSARRARPVISSSSTAIGTPVRAELPALDMMLQLITDRDGRALANGVSEQFIHPRIRDTQDRQRMAIQARLGVANQKLTAAIGLMEARPMSRAMFGRSPPRSACHRASSSACSRSICMRARASTISRCGSTGRARCCCRPPSRYSTWRWPRGFASASHFSRCYRAVYGHKPSDERSASLVRRDRKPNP